MNKQTWEVKATKHIDKQAKKNKQTLQKDLTAGAQWPLNKTSNFNKYTNKKLNTERKNTHKQTNKQTIR